MATDKRSQNNLYLCISPRVHSNNMHMVHILSYFIMVLYGQFTDLLHDFCTGTGE